MVAGAVITVLQRGALEFRHYDLHAYCVMANHVHALLTPLTRIRNITRAVKGIAAQAGNRLLHRTGERFWQDESFDHWVRTEGEFIRIQKYIENNPVKAGLVAKAENSSWSSRLWAAQASCPCQTHKHGTVRARQAGPKNALFCSFALTRGGHSDFQAQAGLPCYLTRVAAVAYRAGTPGTTCSRPREYWSE